MEFRDLTAEEIEVRVQSIKVKDGKPTGVILLLYKNARCDMNILDETVGSENWQREHYECKGNLFCKVGINALYKTPEAEPRWIWKADCGVESNTEAQKGESSDSFKRSCVCHGIGRELYTSPFIWVPADKCSTYDTKRKDRYGQPIFATYDRFAVEKIQIENKKITAISIINESIKSDDIKDKRCYVWVKQ